MRQVPHDYCCIGCEQRVSEHETVFETAAMRRERGASVGMDYIPLQQHSEMQHLVFKKSNNDSMRNSSQFVRRISNDNNNSTAGLSNRTNNVIIHDGNHRMYDSNERVLSISNTSTSTNMKPSSSNTVVTSNDIVVGKRSQVRYSPLSDK